jgi:hypothetical protein
LLAEALPLKDGAQVYRWADQSGHQRDAAPNAGAHEGTGTPPTFKKSSSVAGRPAVHFEAGNGLATPGDRPLPINGDAAYSMVIVANLKRNDAGSSSDVLVGFGEPLDPANALPGRPSAALLQIDRGPEGRHRLDHAGGFSRDALIGRPSSFASFYEFPVIITLVKEPGPMRTTSHLFVNGDVIDTVAPAGTDAAPDLRQRRDFSVIFGHAFQQTGSIMGDIAELLIFSQALDSERRFRLEQHVAAKYNIRLDSPADPSRKPKWSDKAQAHWAYPKRRRPPVPSPNRKDLVRAPLDSFVLLELEAKGLTYSPPAETRTLLRRAYLDLLGFPPGPDEISAFESDHSSDPFANLIDRLLHSPHFGERWARHWLDLAGYVDVNGNDQNAEQIILGQSKWKYRDYVIRAFNEDKPFDQFLREQIAGDELVDWRHATTYTPEIREKLIATGYLRTAIDDTHEVDLNKVPFRYQVLFDSVQIVGSSLFGLTLQCARCHDHKFDPISQRDYFQFMALFTPTFNPHNWLQPKDRELPDVSASERAAIQAHNAALDAKIKPLAEKLAVLEVTLTNRVLAARFHDLPENARHELIAAFHLPPEKRTDKQKALLQQHQSRLALEASQITNKGSRAEKAEREKLTSEIAALSSKKKSWDTIRAFFESSAPPRNYVFVRGDHERRGERVPPGFLSVLLDADEGKFAEENAESSGRRKALALWLTNPDSRGAALTARVIVNRFWQQLFGEGLVRTADNFGVKGMPPSHPALLEWLAAEFIESGWKVKPLLRQMLLSRAYRQSSTVLPQDQTHRLALSVDPEDRLLWRMPLRRVESEVIRDSMLKVSGKLNPRMFGPAVPLITLPDGSITLPPDDQLPEPSAKYRRTIYLMSRRNFHLPILGSFDQPIINTSCARRMSSSVVLQPLSMLNDPFVREQSEAMAEHVTALCGSDRRAEIESAFTLALARSPSNDEMAWSRAFLQDQQHNLASGANSERQALVSLCQMLFNTSEFLYIQ